MGPTSSGQSEPPVGSLREASCTRGAGGLASPDERSQWMVEIPDWSVLSVDGVDRLQRQFKFKNFTEALRFTNAVGALAEEQDHHPALLTEWGKVTVSWWTHSQGGLHKNDFVSAAKTDALYPA